MSKKSNQIKEKIFNAYSSAVLEQEKEPKSVYLFCKELGISEAEFYQHFGSLNHVKGQIFCQFFDNALGLISKGKEFATQSPKEKLLSFYFTFFEVLMLNRSYVLFALDGASADLQKLSVLKELRSAFKGFVSGLIEEGNAVKQTRISKHPEALFSEGAWLQLLFLMKFWMEDDSPGFEKTDMAIEKSVRTVFDLFDKTPIDSIVDLGKFLWKEKIKTP